MIRKTHADPSARKVGDEDNRNQSIGRTQQIRRRPAYAKILTVVIVFTILSWRQSSAPTLIIDRSSDENRSLPRIESSSKNIDSTSTAPKISNSESSSKNSDSTSTAPKISDSESSSKNTDSTSTALESNDGEKGKAKESTSLTTFSYGTMDVNEFKERHHSYLLSRQKELQNSNLSTKARGKGANGNNVTTYAYGHQKFVAGFRNQMMALTTLVMRANYDGHRQVLLNSLMHKDTYGTEECDRFDFYFDVEHWNEFSYNDELSDGSTNTGERSDASPDNHYPNLLPRMVLYDPSLHDQWKIGKGNGLYEGRHLNENSTRPYVFHKAGTWLCANFVRYGKGRGPLVPTQDPNKGATKRIRNPAEILMLRGALKPHPALQAVVDRSKESLRERAYLSRTASVPTTRSSFRYMTLHARVEPDMQNHPVCRNKKVLNLQEIVEMIYSKWPEPPVDVVFLPINRQYLEKEGTLPENFKNDTESDEKINWIAVENLKLLNHLTNHDNENDKSSGMWNGTVPVIEFGTEALRGTVYEHRPSLSGSILNYFLALDAHIFIGTEVSSFSHDVLAARFFRGFKELDTNSTPQAPPADARNAETGKTDTEKGTSIHSNLSSVESDRTWNPRMNNYKYLPDGLKDWIEDDMDAPPGFLC